MQMLRLLVVILGVNVEFFRYEHGVKYATKMRIFCVHILIFTV